MKYLDQAAINYGKAIDAKPDEKYFVDPAEAHRNRDRALQGAGSGTASGSQAPRPQPAAGQLRPPPMPAKDSPMLRSSPWSSRAWRRYRHPSHPWSRRHQFRPHASRPESTTAGGVSPAILAGDENPGCEKAGAEAGCAQRASNTQIITMVKSGMDERTIYTGHQRSQCHRLRPQPRRPAALTSGGVSARVLDAMKARASKKPAGTTRHVAEK